MIFGFTKPLVLNEPEPPTTMIFLFLLYRQLETLLFIVRLSVLVRIILLVGLSKSIYGSISFAVAHLAEPYSSLSRKFFLFFLFMCRKTPTATAVTIPAKISFILKLGRGFVNILFTLLIISIVLLQSLLFEAFRR